MTSHLNHRAVATDLVAEFGGEVPLEAIQERLEALDVDYDHTDVAEIEYLIDHGGERS